MRFALLLALALTLAPATYAAGSGTPSSTSAPSPSRTYVDEAKLSDAIAAYRGRVPEFQFIQAEAKKLGVKAYLFGGTAAAFAHYVKLDQLQKAGDQRLQPDRFDYDYTNIYRSTQDLDLVVDGTEEQAKALEQALAKEYPYFVGSKSAWEVRLLRTDIGLKKALLNNQDFLNQHSDSHSTGLIELTESKDPVVKDLRDWKSAKPAFLSDVAKGRLTYHFSPLHETTEFFKKGDNPPIFSALRYLTKAFQYDLAVDKKDLEKVKQVVAAFDPQKDLPTSYAQGRIETLGTNLVRHAVDMEYAVNEIERLGLKKKLLAAGSAGDKGSMAWWVNKEPLRSFPIGEGTEKTAKELGIEVVAHETDTFTAYESITKSPAGEPNVFISRQNVNGEAAAYGNGFYTQKGRKGARGTGLTVRFTVDPAARLGTDFTLSPDNDYVIVKNKKILRVIPESLNLTWPEYLSILEREDFSSEKGLLQKLERKLQRMAKSISAKEKRQMEELVTENLKSDSPSPAMVSAYIKSGAAKAVDDSIWAQAMLSGDATGAALVEGLAARDPSPKMGKALLEVMHRYLDVSQSREDTIAAFAYHYGDLVDKLIPEYQQSNVLLYRNLFTGNQERPRPMAPGLAARYLIRYDQPNFTDPLVQYAFAKGMAPGSPHADAWKEVFKERQDLVWSAFVRETGKRQPSYPAMETFLKWVSPERREKFLEMAAKSQNRQILEWLFSSEIFRDGKVANRPLLQKLISRRGGDPFGIILSLLKGLPLHGPHAAEGARALLEEKSALTNEFLDGALGLQFQSMDQWKETLQLAGRDLDDEAFLAATIPNGSPNQEQFLAHYRHSGKLSDDLLVKALEKEQGSFGGKAFYAMVRAIPEPERTRNMDLMLPHLKDGVLEQVMSALSSSSTFTPEAKVRYLTALVERELSTGMEGTTAIQLFSHVLRLEDPTRTELIDRLLRGSKRYQDLFHKADELIRKSPRYGAWLRLVTERALVDARDSYFLHSLFLNPTASNVDLLLRHVAGTPLPERGLRIARELLEQPRLAGHPELLEAWVRHQGGYELHKILKTEPWAKNRELLRAVKSVGETSVTEETLTKAFQQGFSFKAYAGPAVAPKSCPDGFGRLVP